MKKTIARLGLISLLSLFTNPGFAYSVSDLLISEIMADPVAFTDTDGEWFELYNPTDQGINLRETWLEDDGGDLHRFETDLLIMPAGYLTLARGDQPGFTPDYVYAGFRLANGADEIVFSDTTGELLRLDYEPGFVLPGQSMELTGDSMHAHQYAPTPLALTFGGGDAGTPGASNSIRLGATAVSAPATLWLIVCGLLALVFTCNTGAASRVRTALLSLSPNTGFTVANLRSISREAY